MKRLTFILLFISSLMASAMPQASLSSDGRILLNISGDDLNRRFLLSSRLRRIDRANGKVYAGGQMKEEPVNIIFSKQNDTIYLERHRAIFIEDGFRYEQKGRVKDGIEAAFPIASGKERLWLIDATNYFTSEIECVWTIPHKEMSEDTLTGAEIISCNNSGKVLEIVVSYSYRNHGDFEMAYYLMPASNLKRMKVQEGIGYKSIRFDRFDGDKKTGHDDFICRWKLHRGSKICFAIDNKVPEEWIPYITEGLLDWNKAFQAAGVGDVIKVVGSVDADEYIGAFNNMVRYYADSDVQNAKGSVMTDPSTGEILQGDILLWNGVIDLLCRWRYLQTGASDPQARAENYPIELLGPMIRYSVCHEAGHVLGLSHNMGASYAYPADSLHSVSFTRKYGTAASVMDYARFNHLATPKEVAGGVSLEPARLGPYDFKAIEAVYGRHHRKHSHEQYTFFSPNISAAIPEDPSAQSETLGNDLIHSSRRGIENCVTLSDSASCWLGRNKEIANQYFKYIFLTLPNIGGAVHGEPVSADIQRETLDFVEEALINSNRLLESPGVTPETAEDLRKIVVSGKESIIKDLEGNYLPERVRKQGIIPYEEYRERVESIKQIIKNQ